MLSYCTKSNNTKRKTKRRQRECKTKTAKKTQNSLQQSTNAVYRGGTYPNIQVHNISAGRFFMAVITKDDKIKMCGEINKYFTDDEIRQISNLKQVRTVCCGYKHLVVLHEDKDTNKNKVSCFGRKQIMNDETKIYEDNDNVKNGTFDNIPSDLNNFANCTQLAAGKTFTIAVFSQNTKLHWWGMGNRQISAVDFLSPIDLGVDVNDSLRTFQFRNNTILQIAAGMNHFVILLDNENVYCFGLNTYKECDIPHKITNGTIKIVQVACGLNHTAALSKDRTMVYTWGANGGGTYYRQVDVSGERGFRKVVYQLVAGCYTTAVLFEDRSMQYWGMMNEKMYSIRLEVQNNIEELAISYETCGAILYDIKTDAERKCMVHVWGNTTSALSITKTCIHSFLEIEPRLQNPTLYAIMERKRIVRDQQLPEQQLAYAEKMGGMYEQHIACGTKYAAFIANNVTVGVFTEQSVSEEKWRRFEFHSIDEGIDKIVQISGGYTHFAVLIENTDTKFRRVECRNIDDTIQMSVPTSLQNKSIKQISCAANYTTAISYDGKVFCWGQGEIMAAGNPRHFSLADELASEKTQTLLKGHKAEQISCGEFHAAIINDAGKIVCWGFVLPTNIPEEVQNGKAIQVVCGNNRTTFVLLLDGSLHGWGLNKENLLSLNEPNSDAYQIVCRTNWQNFYLHVEDRIGLFTVFNKGKLNYWRNSNDSNELTRFFEKNNIQGVNEFAAGETFAAYIDDDGKYNLVQWQHDNEIQPEYIKHNITYVIMGTPRHINVKVRQMLWDKEKERLDAEAAAEAKQRADEEAAIKEAKDARNTLLNNHIEKRIKKIKEEDAAKAKQLADEQAAKEAEAEAERQRLLQKEKAEKQRLLQEEEAKKQRLLQEEDAARKEKEEAEEAARKEKEEAEEAERQRLLEEDEKERQTRNAAFIYIYAFMIVGYVSPQKIPEVEPIALTTYICNAIRKEEEEEEEEDDCGHAAVIKRVTNILKPFFESKNVFYYADEEEGGGPKEISAQEIRQYIIDMTSSPSQTLVRYLSLLLQYPVCRRWLQETDNTDYTAHTFLSLCWNRLTNPPFSDMKQNCRRVFLQKFQHMTSINSAIQFFKNQLQEYHMDNFGEHREIVGKIYQDLQVAMTEYQNINLQMIDFDALQDAITRLYNEVKDDEHLQYFLLK
jgi:alpha-tubulin suppressor-like RCC1 family protein